MKSLAPVVVAVALLSAACVHQQVVKNAPAAPPAPLSVWDRQVKNAVDAGEGDVAFRRLREKVAAEPDNIAARLDLAKAYRERGYHEVALEISRLATARFPESGEAQLSLVRDLREVTRRPEAIAGLEAFLKAHPQSTPEYYSWLGILRDESNLWGLGEPAHRKAVELAPATAYLHNNLGYNLMMQKRYQDATAEFQQALKLKPANALARNNLATALAHTNDTARAVATWQALTDPASAHNNLAAVWMEKGNYAEARRELDLALSYNKAHPAALRNLELLGRLDSNSGIERTAAGTENGQTGWSRFAAGVKRLFVGPLENSKEGAVSTASSQ